MKSISRYGAPPVNVTPMCCPFPVRFAWPECPRPLCGPPPVRVAGSVLCLPSTVPFLSAIYGPFFIRLAGVLARPRCVADFLSALHGPLSIRLAWSISRPQRLLHFLSALGCPPAPVCLEYYSIVVHLPFLTHDPCSTHNEDV